MAKKTASASEAEPAGFAPGTIVRLVDGRQGRILSKAKDSYPEGWNIEGIAGPVAESSLEILEPEAPAAPESPAA